jgi:hypothetical protein
MGNSQPVLVSRHLGVPLTITTIVLHGMAIIITAVHAAHALAGEEVQEDPFRLNHQKFGSRVVPRSVAMGLTPKVRAEQGQVVILLSGMLQNRVRLP